MQLGYLISVNTQRKAKKIDKKWQDFKRKRSNKFYDDSQGDGFITMIERESLIDKLLYMILGEQC